MESGILTILVNKSPSPQVTGIGIACLGRTPMYHTFQNPGSTYEWSVTGGTVIAGSGTSPFTILFGRIGATVHVEAGSYGVENLDISQIVPGLYLLILRMGEETNV